MLPIDPDKKDDVYYRYKMPAVQCKVESSGNGIKTVIPNIHDVCSAVNRPEEVLMKYFQFELGAQSTINVKDDKYLVMGKHAEERMQDVVYSFIKKFVLCGKCRNPETSVALEVTKKNSSVFMLCGACGKKSSMDTADRAYSLMCEYYKRHPEEAKSGKGTAEARKKVSVGEGDDDNAPGPAADSNEEKAAEKKPKGKVIAQSDLADNRKDPRELLADHVRNAESESATAEGTAVAKQGASFSVTPEAMEKLGGLVVRILSEYNMEEAYGARLIISTLFKLHAKELFTAVKVYAPLLRRFATVPELFFRQETFDEKTLSSYLDREAKIQRYLIVECISSVSRTQSAPAEKVPVLLFLLFIEGIVKDTSILKYVEAEEKKASAASALDSEIKANAKALAEWLQIQKELPAAAAAPAPAAAVDDDDDAVTAE